MVATVARTPSAAAGLAILCERSDMEWTLPLSIRRRRCQRLPSDRTGHGRHPLRAGPLRTFSSDSSDLLSRLLSPPCAPLRSVPHHGNHATECLPRQPDRPGATPGRRPHPVPDPGDRRHSLRNFPCRPSPAPRDRGLHAGRCPRLAGAAHRSPFRAGWVALVPYVEGQCDTGHRGCDAVRLGPDDRPAGVRPCTGRLSRIHRRRARRSAPSGRPRRVDLLTRTRSPVLLQVSGGGR
jgi:hypothetical protein